nr:uncharacterized protein LOC109147873 [Ipomoea batatas]
MVQGLSMRPGIKDRPVWKPTGGDFTFKSAKKLMRQQRAAEGLWSRKIWAKGLPWKMSFLAWRVFKCKLPVDDVLIRMGFQIVSKCSCCVHPGSSSLNHIFGMGETARQVWDYFSKSMGLGIKVRSARHVCYEWWLKGIKNRMRKFVADRLPVLILWELWVNHTNCKYGGANPSVQRVIYRVVRNVADCIQRKWPYWDPFPPNWNFILERIERFGCERIVQRSCWCRPPAGSIKVNWAVGRDGLKCGFFARNSRGGFCVAGVYLLQDGGSMGDLVKSMLRDCWSWCWRKRTRKMILVSSVWQRVDVGDLSRFSEEVQVVVNQCTERVNCVADCFVNASANVNIAYIKKDALPRGIGRVLALEGVPHFVFVPGLDFA